MLFNKKNTIRVDNWKMTLPDQMVCSKDIPDYSSERYSFSAVPSDFTDGLDNYKKASIGLGFVQPMSIGNVTAEQFSGMIGRSFNVVINRNNLIVG